MKLLTIIIPSFNMEKYLPKNLDNLVKVQHIEDVEILVVNDGSTDKTLEIAKKYEQDCPSVNVIDKPNGHYGSCLNAALQVATGNTSEYLMLTTGLNQKLLIPLLKG